MVPLRDSALLMPSLNIKPRIGVWIRGFESQEIDQLRQDGMGGAIAAAACRTLKEKHPVVQLQAAARFGHHGADARQVIPVFRVEKILEG